MPSVKVKGRVVRTLIELTIEELELEATYVMDRAVLEAHKLGMQGFTQAEATSIVLAQVGTESEFVKAWMNKNARIIDEIHSQMVSQPCRQFAKENPKELFLWELDSGANHCGDCSVMSDLPPSTIERILDEGVGLPREGSTQCNVGCRCQLTPA